MSGLQSEALSAGGLAGRSCGGRQGLGKSMTPNLPRAGRATGNRGTRIAHGTACHGQVLQMLGIIALLEIF